MASDLRSGRLSDIADIVMGQSPPGNTCNAAGNGVPLLNGPTEFGGHHPIHVQFTTDPKKFSQKGDILFCVRGSTTGRMNWADQKYAIGRGIAAIRHKSGDDYQPFLRGLIENSLPTLLVSATGSTFPNVSRNQLLGLHIQALPLPEQRAISHILGSLDDKIELNRRMNETLEATARAIFKSWFVDFDPVRAKAEGGDPGLQDDVAALFPDGFEDSELGEIPRGWKNGVVGGIGSQSRNGIKPEEIDNSEYYIALEHMPKRSISLWIWTNSENITSGKFRFKKNNILFGKLRPYFHKVGVPAIDGVCSTDIVVIVPKEEHFFGLLLGHLSSDKFVAYTSAASTGTKMPRTNWKDMSRYPIVLPDSEVLTIFTQHIKHIVNKLHANIHESNTLASLRDTLLPKLISGELRVPDAEALLYELNINGGQHG